MPRHPAAARGTGLAARRPQHRRDQRPRPGRAARIHRRAARRASGRAQPDDHRFARGTERHAHPAARRGSQLPDTRPVRRLAVDGGAAADRAHLDGTREHHGNAVCAGRAVCRAPPDQHSGAAQDDHRAGRERQLRRGGGARAGDRPDRGLGHRAGSRRRSQRRQRDRRGSSRPTGEGPALDHGPVPGWRSGRAR